MYENFKLCQRCTLFFTAEKHKYSVCRSNSQRDRHLKLDKVGKILHCNFKPQKQSSPFTLCMPSCKQRQLSSNPYLTQIRRVFFSELCPVKSCNCNTLSPALYIPRENFLEVGMGYSNEGVCLSSGSRELGRPTWKPQTGMRGGRLRLTPRALVWDRLWNFPSSGCRQRSRKNLILGQP